MKYKYIFFDLDGTLIDPSEGVFECIAKALESEDCDVPHIFTLKKFIGPPIGYSLRTFCNLPDELADRVLLIYRKLYNEIGIKKVKVYEGIKHILSYLAKNDYVICVATMKKEERAIKILKNCKIFNYFDFVSGADDESNPKKANIIKKVINNMNIQEIGSILMIGDSKYDLMGAKELNIDFCAVTYGFDFNASDDRLSNFNLILRQPIDLKRILANLN